MDIFWLIVIFGCLCAVLYWYVVNEIAGEDGTAGLLALQTQKISDGLSKTGRRYVEKETRATIKTAKPRSVSAARKARAAREAAQKAQTKKQSHKQARGSVAIRDAHGNHDGERRYRVKGEGKKARERAARDTALTASRAYARPRNGDHDAPDAPAPSGIPMRATKVGGVHIGGHAHDPAIRPAYANRAKG